MWFLLVQSCLHHRVDLALADGVYHLEQEEQQQEQEQQPQQEQEPTQFQTDQDPSQVSEEPKAVEGKHRSMVP